MNRQDQTDKDTIQENELISIDIVFSPGKGSVVEYDKIIDAIVAAIPKILINTIDCTNFMLLQINLFKGKPIVDENNRPKTTVQ